MHTSVTAHYSSAGETDDRAPASIFAAYTVTAAPWLMFATGVGILLAYKLAHLISAVPAR